MNRLEVVAKQIVGARVNGPSLADRGIRTVTVPTRLTLARRKRLLMAVEAAAADPSVTYIVFVGAGSEDEAVVGGGNTVAAAASSAIGGGSGPAGAAVFCHGADPNEFASSDVVIPFGTRLQQRRRKPNEAAAPREEAFFRSPTISEVVEAIEACPKVTVAAIAGHCAAEGAELILACDYRVATRACTISFDQIRRLGLVPCAGGTQRLPRAVGIQTAVHWITSGKIISAENALDKGLLDHIISPPTPAPTPGNVTPMAGATPATPLSSLLFATRDLLADAAVTQISVAGGPTFSANRKRRLSETMGKIPFAIAANILEAICRRDLFAKMPKGFDAPQHALKAVMSYSSGNFKVGLAAERRIFDEVYESTQSLAMRHLQRAKARAAEGPASGTVQQPQFSSAASSASAADEHGGALQCPLTGGVNAIRTIGIIGGGEMGSSIAACFLAAGYRVIVVDLSADHVARCSQRVQAIFRPHVERRRITAKQFDERMALLTVIGGSAYQSSIAEADIVIEAIYEDVALKRRVFEELDAICKPSCILASNTATIDINTIAEATRRPERVVGIHFFSPAHIMQLVEIVKGAGTSDETILRLLHLTKRIRKIGVVVGNAFGFVSNRLAIRGVFQAVCLVEDGAFPYQIDGYLKDFGFANGIFEMQDMAGLDVASALLSVMPTDLKMARSVSTIPRELMAAGRLGVKTGRGWYRYDAEEPTRPLSDINVERLCIATSEKKGILRRTVPKKEATYRFLFHIINEAALLLEQGVAVRPSDIDLIFVLGFGFPYFRGGPCYVADQMGIDNVIEKMQIFASTCGRSTFPPPCKFLLEMARNKKRFSDFNN